MHTATFPGKQLREDGCITVRRARKDDSNLLAELINFAGEGLPLYLWTSLTGPGDDPWDIGQRRAARETGGFSYRNSTIAEVDGVIAGALIGYPLANDPRVIRKEDTPPMFLPIAALENIACGTWYVNAVATYPEYRGLGVGSILLHTAEKIAMKRGLRGMSLIVSDANHGARRLYEGFGYREVTSRPVMKEQWENEGENWVLMIKEFDQ